MKTLLSLLLAAFVLSTSSSAFADEPLPVYMKVRKFIEAQATTENSELNQAIQKLIAEGNLPDGSYLELAGVDLLQEGPKHEQKECHRECRIYEISEYRQISDLRWKSADGTKTTLWVIGIYASFVKAWTLDASGNKLKPIGEDVVLDAVDFLR